MLEDLPLHQTRSWLLAADHPARREALLGCTLDDAVSEEEWLIEAVEGTILRLMDMDDETGERRASRDLRRLSEDAVILLPADLPARQRATLAEALGPPLSLEDQANRDMLTAMGLDPDQVGGRPWQKHIAAVARSTEAGVAVPAHALEALHRHLTLLGAHRPALALLLAVADDDPIPLSRARARLFAAQHCRALGRTQRGLEVSQALIAGHRQLPRALLAETLVFRADCLCDQAAWAEAERLIRWAWATAQSPAASAVFERIKRRA